MDSNISLLLNKVRQDGVFSTVKAINDHVQKPIRKKTISKQGYTDSDKYKLLWINPQVITHQYTYLDRKQINDLGGVYSGLWDKPRQICEKSIEYRSFKRYIESGIALKETPICKKLHEKGLSEKEINNKLYQIEELICSIKKGYKTQSKLQNDKSKKRINEIGVCISRSGELIRNGEGRYRLLIAKVLDLSAVPVQVRVRHKKWQDKRDLVRETSDYSRLNIDPNLLYHPDLQDIV